MPEKDFEVGIGSVRFDPLEEQEKSADNDEPTRVGKGTLAWIVQFTHALTLPERTRLMGTFGLSLDDYVPKRAYVELLDLDRVVRLREDEAVRAVSPYLVATKISPDVVAPPTDPTDDEPATTRLCAVLFHQATPSTVVDKLSGLGAGDVVRLDSREAGGRLVIVFSLPAGELDAVAGIDEVRWVEPAGHVVDDDRTAVAPTTIAAQFAPAWARGLHGEGQVIGILDNGPPDIEHCFFRDPTQDPQQPGPGHRKVAGVSNAGGTAPGRHATFVAGCASGDDATQPGSSPARGGAWAARLFCGNRNDLAVFAGQSGPEGISMLDALTATTASGAAVHSNSFHVEQGAGGGSGTAGYSVVAADVDTFTWLNEEHLVVASCGNTGERQGPPGTAKNTLCVGAAALQSDGATMGDGAPGPTPDGRRKPELLMVGCRIRSAITGTPCGTGPGQSSCASSYATPLAAAAATLVRQLLSEDPVFGEAGDGERRSTPSAALLKGLLLDSTVPVGGFTLPSDRVGWGAVSLWRSLLNPEQDPLPAFWDVRNSAGLHTGMVFERSLNVPEQAGRLRVTLVWTEHAGALGADDPVVNNLDLKVLPPDGGPPFLGNVMSQGRSVVGGGSDTRNNVECVLVEDPAPGVWTARVVADEVNVGNPGQGFALVVSGARAIAR
ncbi:S8 family serine peptidase [Streptomyces sp. NPDC090057]|uniref:S8 family serine peptidase n=1 Tax=Streptomyces sp. NPDC090057 TaxID=3365935 RepID=UPI00382C3E73